MSHARAIVTRLALAALVLLTAALQPRPAAAQPPGYVYPYPVPAQTPVPRQPQPPSVAQPRRAQTFGDDMPALTWEPLRFAITGQGRTTWPIDGGAQRLASQRAVDSGGVSLQADVFRLLPRLVLRADAGWESSSTSSLQQDSSLEERVKTNLFTLGASLRYDLWRWLSPFARLSFGLGWDKLTVASARDRDFFEQGSAGAGLMLRTPGLRLWQARWAPAFGALLLVEGGYTLATGSDFVLHPSLGSASSAPIPTNQVALGHVGRSAPYLRIAFGLAF